MNSTIPSGYSAYLFAPRKLADFEGNLSKISFKLKWTEINTTDTLKTWATNFLGKNYAAKSTPNLTSYTSEKAQNLPPLTVMIFEPKGNDSKYIKAALRAIADYTKRKIVINDFKADLQADIIFWFAEQQISSTYIAKLKPGAKVFLYVNGKASSVSSTVQFSNTETANIGLHQKIEIEKQHGEAIWKDGFGEPLLIKQQNNQIINYYFYSKFNPQWTDLVWNEEMVSALMPIVLGNEKAVDFGFENNENDQRVLASNQNLYFKNTTDNTKITGIENIATANYLWIFAFVILTLERILSFRKTKLNDGKN